MKRNPVLYILIAFGALLLHLFWRAFRDRLRHGTYIEGREAGRRAIETYHGKFVFDPRSRNIRIKTPKGGLFRLAYDDIVCLNFEKGWQQATMSEFLFEDSSILDLSGRYRDRMHSYNVFIKTRNGTVPFFTVSQYEVRDFLDFVTPILQGILKLLHLRRNVRDYANEIRDKVTQAFASEGIQLQPGRDWM
ncbi:MAG: hypothetical protein JRJ87_01530 [Deltaproteobacteria bacterium]|nr:hypothetical protein [Deltaproteobacteria bacterium]